MSDDTDPETLRERVRELEQTADDLRETVAELQQRRGPSRRDLLKVGSGGLLGAGLLASSQPVSAAPASADTSAGQVGVAGDSEDVVLDQLRDPGGDEIMNVDDTGGINAQFGREWYFDSVDIEQADITNETFIEAVRGAANSGVSSTTWVNLVDSENVDNRGEFNSNQHFVPDETGWYEFSGLIDVEPGADGDLIQSKIQDITNGSALTKLNEQQTGGSSQFHRFPFAATVELTAGVEYEIQVRDLDSSFTVDELSRVIIKREVIHP